MKNIRKRSTPNGAAACGATGMRIAGMHGGGPHPRRARTAAIPKSKRHGQLQKKQ